MAHGKYKVRRKQLARDQRWQERRAATQSCFDQKRVERMEPRAVVVGIKPPGDDGGPVR